MATKERRRRGYVDTEVRHNGALPHVAGKRALEDGNRFPQEEMEPGGFAAQHRARVFTRENERRRRASGDGCAVRVSDKSSRES